jgi:SHS2 domain-containing protein
MSDGGPWFRLLDHTGDMAILVRAPSLEGLYDGLTRAFFEVLMDTRTITASHRVAVGVDDAVDAEDLVVRYLSELLFLHDARGWVFRGAEVRRVSDTAIEAEALGEPFDPQKHAIDRQIKAVTHHHLLLSRDRDGWTARCVLDL